MPEFSLFDLGRPDPATLAERFGVRVPQLLVRFLQWVYDRGGDATGAEDLMFGLLHLDTRETNRVVFGPAELFVVAGQDDWNIGFVSLAPEVPQDDYPWLWYAPDGSAHDPLGRDTATFLADSLSHRLTSDDAPADDILAAAEAFALPVSVERGRAVGPWGSSKYYETGEPAPVFSPAVPAGYRHLPGRDGDPGVLAPEAAFAPGLVQLDPATDIVDQLEQLIIKDHPASALVLLRDRDIGYRVIDRSYSIWLRLMQRAYEDLGRPLMARRVAEQVW
jgi:hypothetical protein